MKRALRGDMGALQQLRDCFRGALIQPGDAGYDAARKVYNASIDRRPRCIARCADVADVIAGVNFAREKNLSLAMRGGGHSVPGFGTCDDGLVLDLSPMRGIRIAARTAVSGASSQPDDVWRGSGLYRSGRKGRDSIGANP